MKTISQRDYFFAIIFQVVGIIIAAFYLEYSSRTSLDLWIGSIIAIITLLYTFITTNRRLNDAKWSQLLLILLFIPFIGFIFQIILLFAPTRRDAVSSLFPKTQHDENNLRPLLQKNAPVITIPKMPTSNNSDWETVYREYHSQGRNVGLYAKLFALYSGDETKILAAYLNERIAEIENANSIIRNEDLFLRDRILYSNVFTFKDGYVVGMREPTTFFVFKNEAFWFYTSSITELEAYSDDLKQRRLLSLDEKSKFLQNRVLFILNIVKSRA